MARRLTLPLLWLALALASCASTRAGMAEWARGSCQAQCHDDNPDSLYDENRCAEDCT